MKKVILMMMLAFGIAQTFAQEYIPFVREGVKWVCYYNNYYKNTYPYGQYYKDGKTYFTLEMKGDVEINGNTYKAMHKYSGDAIDPENDTVLICLREQDKIVYGIVPDGNVYPDFRIGYGLPFGSDYPFPEINSGNEFVLYNFNDPDTWCQWIYRRNSDRLELTGSDMIDIGGKTATRHTYKFDGNQYFYIDGIGVDGFYPCYPLSYMNISSYDSYPFYLSHVIEDGEIIYKGINYEYIAPFDGRLPIAREGVKWVNERVIINKGDTTRYYYTYELKGDDEEANQQHNWNMYKYCHYYTGDKIDPDNDSIICSMGESPDMYFTYVVHNRAMEQVEQEGRNILQRVYLSPDSTSQQLYYFDHTNPQRVYLQYSGWQNWREMEKPFFINKDTFFEVEPVEVDGHECRRYAFVGEDGEPQAYVVEGIGFDSRDMGDLLTQFTRKPDADADYQEYCGLSHVIKDGKIIYKGMRYREDAPELPQGDMNGDGELTIDDVTILIDALLTDTPRYNAGVTISEVTSIIDLLLSESPAQ